MSLLSAGGLSKSFGAEDVFSGIALDIPHGARIAIVGPNGIGKTTLLRILLGLEEPSAGSVSRARNVQIGYLPQEAYLDATHTLHEECLGALSNLRALEAELARLEAAMGDAEQAEAALERYGRLQHEFERRGGYTYEQRIRQTLGGLGFAEGDFNRPIPQLSGGQRTRALLARLLLSDPDLLILDEPTNHLDIQAVEWLEGYLSHWEGATLIVSHDRYFLDRVVDHIWEMRRDGMEVYRGNYSAYVQQRQERWDLRQQLYEAEMERLLKEVDYIKRNISGQNTLQAKGRLRRMSREVQAIEQLGFEAARSKNWLEIADQAEIAAHPLSVAELERRVRSLRGPSNRPPHLHLNLNASQRSGDLVLRTRDLAVGYADEGKPLFRTADLLLKRGECAAVIGPNGAGKTTFLKTLLDQMPPLEGKVIWGASLDIAYFAQAHEGLRAERTLMQEIDSVAPHMLPGEVRDYLARFLFTGDDAFKPVSVLSGGERGRLALAKLALSNANLLLLDEPTNHLDIPSQEVLQEVLADYPGTVLLVSHDRYLIDALATQIWEILPDQTELQIFAGGYTQYRQYLEDRAAISNQRSATEQNSAGGQRAAGGDQRPDKIQEVSEKAQKQAEKKRQVRLRVVEEKITALEGQLAVLSSRLERPPADAAEVRKMGQEYVRLQDELNTLMNEWESLHS